MTDLKKIPQIIDYEDYRDFLKVKFEYLKNKYSKFSYRYLASKIGTTDNTFKYIFERKRNISVNLAVKTAKAFQLNHLETQYLTYCVIKNSVADTDMLNVLSSFLIILKEAIKEQNNAVCLKKAHSNQESENDWLKLIIKKVSVFKNYNHDASWIFQQIVSSDIHAEHEISAVMNTEIANKDPHETLMPNLLEEIFNNIVDSKPRDFDVSLLLAKSSDLKKIHEARSRFLSRILKIEAESKKPDILIAVYGAAFNASKIDGEYI